MNLRSFGIAMALTAALTAGAAHAEGPEYASYGVVQAPPTEKSDQLVNDMRAWRNREASGEAVFEKAVELVGKDIGDKHLVGTRTSFAARVMELPESAGRTEAALSFLFVATRYLKECRSVEESMDKSDAWMNGRFARQTEVVIRERCADVLALEGPNILGWLTSPADLEKHPEIARYRNKYVDPNFTFLPDAFEQIVWSGPWNDPNSEYDRDCIDHIHRKVCGAVAKLAARVLYVEKKYGKPDDERVKAEAMNVGYLIGSYHAGMSRGLESRYNAIKLAEESDAMVKKILGAWAMALGGGLISTWELEAVSALADATGAAATEAWASQGGVADAVRTRGKRGNDESCQAFRGLVFQLLRFSNEHSTPFREAMDAMTEIRVNHDQQ